MTFKIITQKNQGNRGQTISKSQKKMSDFNWNIPYSSVLSTNPRASPIHVGIGM
jgi:hypothetical protein